MSSNDRVEEADLSSSESSSTGSIEIIRDDHFETTCMSLPTDFSCDAPSTPVNCPEECAEDAAQNSYNFCNGNFCPPPPYRDEFREEEMDYSMMESVDSDCTTYSDNKVRQPVTISQILGITAISMVAVVFLSLANTTSSIRGCDEIMSQVKKFTIDIKAENDAFKKQIQTEVQEKLYSDLLRRINELKAESEKLNGILYKIASKGTYTDISVADIYFGNNTEDSVKALKASFMKDAAYLSSKICIAFCMIMLLLKFSWEFTQSKRYLTECLNEYNREHQFDRYSILGVLNPSPKKRYKIDEYA